MLWDTAEEKGGTSHPPPLCFVVKQNIEEVARSNGGVENGISSAGLYWTFNSLARWALPLYRCAAQGERFESVASNILSFSIAVPRSFMEYFCFTIGDI